MKKLTLLMLLLPVLLIPSGCTGDKAIYNERLSLPVQPVISSEQKTKTISEVLSDISSAADAVSVVFADDDLDTGTENNRITYIKLNGSSISVDGYGAGVNGSTVMITSAGTYNISGTLDDGQIKIFTGDKGAVRLILNGAHINCSHSAPIYAVSAEKTVIILSEGSENSITDGETYIFEDKAVDEPEAAIFVKEDLTITGSGALTVNARYKNGIQSKDNLKITGGSITVTAANDGIKGKDSVAVKDGIITITAKGDGMQSNNDKDAAKGFIFIEDGVFTIDAGADGIQAETTLVILDGTMAITTGGGSAQATDNRANQGMMPGRMGMQSTTAAADSSASAKGLKAGTAIVISGAAITIDSSEDAIHSNQYVKITGGDINIACGDDAVHADTSLVIDGGTIAVTKSYEGLESTMIVLNGGSIHLVSSDDGINVNGGSEGFPMGRGGTPMGGIPVMNSGSETSGSSTDYCLTINGGYISIDAGGDGIDVNGPVQMTGGTVIVNGPTNNGNGALDYTGSFVISGGYLVAAGSSGMAQAPGGSSILNSLMINFTQPQEAGAPVHIQTASGGHILTFAPKKVYQSLVLSSPDVKKGETYIIFTGGSSTGTETDGVYSGGEYSDGIQLTTLIIKNTVTMYGAAGGGMGGGGFQGGGGFPGGGMRR